MAKEKSKDTRCRNWTIVVYPGKDENDGSPENWRDIIEEQHIEWIESPLHDKDTLPTGETKKPHYHVLLMFGGVKSYEQVLELCQELNCPIPERVHNAKALVRYMAHLDSPDKVQYNLQDIIAHGGVDIAEMLRPSSSERYTLINEMRDFIKEYNILEFQDILDYAAANRFDDWFPLLCDNSTFIIDKYIKSQRHRIQNVPEGKGVVNKPKEEKNNGNGAESECSV